MLLAHLFLQLWLVMLLLQEVRGWAAFTILCNNVLQGWAFFFFFYPLRKLNRQLAAAAAAKSLQSCPTLWDPIDGSPPGSPVLGLSRQEYWSRLPFPSPMHACMLSHFSHVQFCATQWPAAHQAPLSTGFSRQEHRQLKLGQILSHWLVVARSSTGRGLMACEQCELFEESKIKN